MKNLNPKYSRDNQRFIIVWDQDQEKLEVKILKSLWKANTDLKIDKENPTWSGNIVKISLKRETIESEESHKNPTAEIPTNLQRESSKTTTFHRIGGESLEILPEETKGIQNKSRNNESQRILTRQSIKSNRVSKASSENLHESIV